MEFSKFPTIPGMITSSNQLTIYHNPGCSKSRQTLDLLRERGLEPVVVPYLDDPPDEDSLRKILDILGLRPIDLMRTKESVFKNLGIGERDENALDYDDKLVATMVANPVLIERPIVICGDQGRIGRPPEQVLEII